MAMRTSSWKRLGSSLLAVTMALSSVALPVSAAPTPGKDGSAEMNEAYAAHESLMPIGPSFSVATLLEWTPESDPDARYSRASIPLVDRKGGFVVNPKANPEAKLMLCSLANSSHDTTSAQGTENFMSWAFNYWQYTDSFVYWSGSEEGLICLPTGEFTDAAHTNGVPVVATLGFPWGEGDGYAQEVSDFCQKAEDGSFPVADKMLELMDYYGFDGYFFNQESFGCDAEIASRLDEMIRYMRAKCPDILISWYDSMLPSGSVSYQNAVNSANQAWMERSEDGSVGINEFFMNYNWYNGQIETTVQTMNAIDRSPFDAFAGLDVQQNGMRTPFRDNLLVDEDGKLKISIALYCPNSTLGNSADGAQFHEIEQDFYTNTASDPRVEVADVSSSTWLGMSRFFADKTPILSAPFVTNFNSGHGVAYYVDGEISRNGEWSYQSVQDVMPTWTWIIDSEGAKLNGGYDFTDAYNGGNSIQFRGSLDANTPNDIMLYSTNVTVAEGMTLSLTAKNDDGKAKLVAYYGDENAASYADCEQVAYDLQASEADTWTTTVADISDQAGKTLYAIGLQVESDTAVEDYKINLGQLAILDQDRAALSGPASVTLDEILYHNAYEAEARIYWDAVDGAASYEIYKVNADGASLIMETPNTAFYLPTLARNFDEEDVTLKVVPVNANGVRGAGAELFIDWQYGNDDSEVYVPDDFENVCLNAEVTGVSFENESEPASKAIDGTALNGSKWCATNNEQGWMSIDIGREVTVRRWRVEHAEYGGEDVLMNTVDFALEYKDENGEWVQVKRIQNNTAAVTDVLLDEPVTAQEWRLYVYDDGTSPWGGIRIYEWQMFETEEFSQTEPIPIQFASAENGEGANDTFTLKNVPVGQTVKVYTKSGAEYTQIGEAVTEDSTVTITGLDFGTADAGRIYYTTTAIASRESIKMAARFEAEGVEKSAPAMSIDCTPYSQPGSVSSSNGEDIFISLTVNRLEPGDVVYVYEADPLTRSVSSNYTKMSLPVAEGASSVTISGIRVPRAGCMLTLQVKRVGQLLSDPYQVKIDAFEEPQAYLKLNAADILGEAVNGAVYDIYNADGEKVGSVTSGAEETATVDLGNYTLKCVSVPEGYLVSTDDAKIIAVTEGKTYDVNVTLTGASGEPVVAGVTVVPANAMVEKGATQLFDAQVNGENLTDKSVTWSVTGAAAEGTTIDENGLLTIAADETATELTVVATANQDNTTTGTAKVTVTEPAEKVELVSQGANVIGTNSTATEDGPANLFDGNKSDGGMWYEEGSNLWVAFDISEVRNAKQLVVTHYGAVTDEDIAVNADEGVDANADKSVDKTGLNTRYYEFYVLDESKVTTDALLAMAPEDRNEALATNENWKQIAATTDNSEPVTTNDLTDAAGRIFKLNVSVPSSEGTQTVRIYEAELFATVKGDEPAPTPVDKTILNGLIAEAGACEANDYTATSWALFETALAQANTVAADENATQQAVNEAANALSDALDGLVRRANNANLVAAIASAHELDETQYTGDSWAALAQAVADGQAVADDRDATAEQIEAARAAIAAAIQALKARADMTSLNEAIAAADAKDANAYTAESWKAIAEKLEIAKAVAADTNATQDAVNAAALELQTAMAALEEAGDATALNEAIAKAKAMDLTQYTNESASAIRQAVSDAEAAVAARADAATLQAALDALNKAVDSAETKPSAPETDPSDDSQDSASQGSSSGSSGSASTTPAPSAPAAADGTVYYTCPACGTHDWTATAEGYRCDNCGKLESVKQLSGYGNVKGLYTPQTGAAAGGSSAASAIPQTGDDLPYALLVVLACASAAGVGLALTGRVMRRRNQK